MLNGSPEAFIRNPTHILHIRSLAVGACSRYNLPVHYFISLLVYCFYTMAAPDRRLLVSAEICPASSFPSHVPMMTTLGNAHRWMAGSRLSSDRGDFWA